MYRVYELTEKEKEKITKQHWDGDTYYYDVFDSLEEYKKEEERLAKIDEEYDKAMKEYMNNSKSENSEFITNFKEKTYDNFQNVCNKTAKEIEDYVMEFSSQVAREEFDAEVEILDVAVYGSRCRGLEKPDSDIDVVISYVGDIKEDDFFNALAERELNLVGNSQQIKVDLNPIEEYTKGRFADYLMGCESFLKEKANDINKEKNHKNKSVR